MFHVELRGGGWCARSTPAPQAAGEPPRAGSCRQACVPRRQSRTRCRHGGTTRIGHDGVPPSVAATMCVVESGPRATGGPWELGGTSPLGQAGPVPNWVAPVGRTSRSLRPGQGLGWPEHGGPLLVGRQDAPASGSIGYCSPRGRSEEISAPETVGTVDSVDPGLAGPGWAWLGPGIARCRGSSDRATGVTHSVRAGR